MRKITLKNVFLVLRPTRSPAPLPAVTGRVARLSTSLWGQRTRFAGGVALWQITKSFIAVFGVAAVLLIFPSDAETRLIAESMALVAGSPQHGHGCSEASSSSITFQCIYGGNSAGPE